ncbi:hypothetical protein Aduo_007697 [Ancylostoma duodenale]
MYLDNSLCLLSNQDSSSNQSAYQSTNHSRARSLMVGDGDRGGLTPRSLLASANMVRQQSDTTGVRRLVRGVAIEDDRPQTSQVRVVNRSLD